MFNEVHEIIEDYDRDKRARAEEFYGELFEMLHGLDATIREPHDNDEDRTALLAEMKEIASNAPLPAYLATVATSFY
ncbi:hypothetical protein LAC81_27110 [Ensifer adhaerens]|uniref:hypothetical protein n=1 Tax=Ensifer adhaerens TaxID=106592 RepID=UPI001CC0D656|nr:hypothetical protein [Ensifer adhaerens]MBZ7924401.1 hypothetical protein [Ensifer adhaerens]UAX96353.1 hypothetical protein LAC78_21375 [Ensifer adhaerens]UAY04304.1 hypothetical protein LAC80_23585 [Ensifer adhaerens]UAY12290.1 hypothetical protein LAC81_27110 [Ensifer adhaerens]